MSGILVTTVAPGVPAASRTSVGTSSSEVALPTRTTRAAGTSCFATDASNASSSRGRVPMVTMTTPIRGDKDMTAHSSDWQALMLGQRP